MKRLTTALAALFIVLVAASCASHGKQKSLDDTLRQYEAVVRWSEWDGAVNFLAPEYLEVHPVSRLDLERLRLFRVTQYIVRSGAPLEGGNRYQQSVEIRMFNRNRAIEKVVVDQQDWRYHPETERWLLHSGLPDVTQRY